MSMSMPFPEKDFAWRTPEQIDEFDVMDIPGDSKTGYILELNSTIKIIFTIIAMIIL